MKKPEIPPKIKQALKIISDRLKNKEITWCVVGSCALLLHGIDIPEIHDIDIITDKEGAYDICKHLISHEVSSPEEKKSNNFVSVMGILNIHEIKIEVMGDLKYKAAQDITWHTSSKMLHSPEIMQIDDFTTPVATLQDLLDVYQTMGREKDLKKIEAIKKFQERGK